MNAFATNRIVNGRWTSTTANADAVLHYYNQKDKEATTSAVERQKSPMLGLLSQTVLRSPVVHWILPVQLRDKHSNDVAFIGDFFIEIKVLQLDGSLSSVVVKNNFGARIRNACVVGPSKRKDSEDILAAQVKEEHDIYGSRQRPSPARDPLPPQAILLQFDTGDSLFLSLRRNNESGWEFVSNRHRVSKAMLTVEPGTHLAVDPSSRYVAVGCSEGIFAIYALNSREELERQHENHEQVRYLKSERYISLRGVIHKMAFLYPEASDDKHIILLILVVFKGRTRMLLYEWEAGCDLRQMRAHSRRGHRLEPLRQMPLLLVPLRLRSMFLLISESMIALCKGILEGSPVFLDFPTSYPPTSIHYGSNLPLWTAWARPHRLSYHTATQDNVYLVREDGLTNYLEVNEDDGPIEHGIGSMESNCGGALACLDYTPLDGNTGDLLITGGDACTGATYVVLARQTPVLRETIVNWSPAQDIVTTSAFQDYDSAEPPKVSRHKEFLPKPNRVFACVGKGVTGAISEFRVGLEARLSLETEFSSAIVEAWMAPVALCPHEEEDGSLFLLSLIDRSALLYLSADGSEIGELSHDSTCLDLTYRTIATSLYGDCVIQVTDHSVFFANNSGKHKFEASQLLQIHDEDKLIGTGVALNSAVVRDSIVIFTTHMQYDTYLQILDLRLGDSMNTGDLDFSLGQHNTRTLMRCSPNVTSLALCTIRGAPCAVVAEWATDAVTLTFHCIDGGLERSINMSSAGENQNRHFDAFMSISAYSGEPGSLILVCGTRNGIVVCLHIREDDFTITSNWSARIGATSVMVKTDETFQDENLVFMTCDSKLYSLNILTAQELPLARDSTNDRRVINQVWLTDTANPYLQQPSITSLALPSSTSLNGTSAEILLICGSQLLFSNLSIQSKPVPRSIPLGGTPTRLLYSQSLKALIVAASVEGRCTILFIDPDSGLDLSRSTEKTGERVKYVAGLGEENARVYRLIEWPFKKDGRTWSFIVACTSTGRLLIMSAEREKPQRHYPEVMDTDPPTDQTPLPPGIRYFTRYKFKCAKPVYAVTGYSEGLMYCAGNTIFCDRLNLAEKKFETIGRYELPSAAVDLMYDGEKLYATTIAHSLEVLKIIRNNDGSIDMATTHCDQVTRSSLHHRLLGSASENPISLLSDKSRNVVGLWATKNTKADVLDVVFEAQLSQSMLKFRAGNCRPIWDPTWDDARGGPAPFDPVTMSGTYPELLGLSIDGSLHHFTVIPFKTWRFLRFLVNLALQSPTICEFTYSSGTLSLEPESEPKKMMHIDGDILRRIQVKDLEQLLRMQEDSNDAREVQDFFCGLLRDMYPEELGADDDLDVYIRRAHRDLDFLLRPVL